MENNSISASCPEQIFANVANVKNSLLEASTGPLGTHSFVASQFAHFDELRLNSPLLIESYIPPENLIFAIKADTNSRLILNDRISSIDDRIVSVISGSKFKAMCGSGHRSFTLAINPKLLADSLPQEHFDRRLLHETHEYAVSRSLHNILIEQSESILDINDDETLFNEAVMELSLTLLVALSRLEPVSTTNRLRIIRTAVSYISEHPHEQIPVEQLADVAHCSVRSLQYAFRKTFGLSPKQYETRYRLNQFRRELLATYDAGHNGQIGALAREYEFNHGGNLSRLYKELFGTLPSEGCSCDLHAHLEMSGTQLAELLNS